MARQVCGTFSRQKRQVWRSNCLSPGQWCAIPAKVDSNSIPIPGKALWFNSNSNSTLEYISSIQFQFQFHPWKYELNLAFNSIPIPIPPCDFSLWFNSDSNSIGPKNPWNFDSSSNSGIGIAHHWSWTSDMRNGQAYQYSCRKNHTVSMSNGVQNGLAFNMVAGSPVNLFLIS